MENMNADKKRARISALSAGTTLVGAFAGFGAGKFEGAALGAAAGYAAGTVLEKVGLKLIYEFINK